MIINGQTITPGQGHQPHSSGSSMSPHPGMTNVRIGQPTVVVDGQTVHHNPGIQVNVPSIRGQNVATGSPASPHSGPRSPPSPPSAPSPPPAPPSLETPRQQSKGKGPSDAAPRGTSETSTRRGPTWSQNLPSGTTTTLLDDNGAVIKGIKLVKVTKTSQGDVVIHEGIKIKAGEGESISFGNTYLR